jgi:hypothetical protein
MPNHKWILTITLLFIASACNSIVKNEKFDKTKWTTKDDLDYTMRDAMLSDLISNHKLKGLTYQQLIDSLGEPANYGESKDSVYYDIVVNYGYLDPKSGKYLVLPLNKDSVVTGFKVVEWHNRHANE